MGRGDKLLKILGISGPSNTGSKTTVTRNPVEEPKPRACPSRKPVVENKSRALPVRHKPVVKPKVIAFPARKPAVVQDEARACPVKNPVVEPIPKESDAEEPSNLPKEHPQHKVRRWLFHEEVTEDPKALISSPLHSPVRGPVSEASLKSLRQSPECLNLDGQDGELNHTEMSRDANADLQEITKKASTERIENDEQSTLVLSPNSSLLNGIFNQGGHENVTPDGGVVVVIQREQQFRNSNLITPPQEEVFVDFVPPSNTGPRARKQLFVGSDEQEGDGVLVLPLDEPLFLDGTIAVNEGEHVELTSNNLEPPSTIPTTKKRKRTHIPSEEPSSRKKKINTSKWKASQAKLAYNSGLPHVSLRGKEIKGREMKPGCSDSCKRKCVFKITPERRQALFDKYWGLKDKGLQWYFLAKLVHSVNVKRRRAVIVEDEEPYRKNSYEYGLSDSLCQRVIVCQKMFLETFDISIKVVKTALVKNSPDKRGKHTENRRRMSSILIDGVKAHIKSYPVVPSHYCRADTSRKYLDEHLTVGQMYRMYILVRNINDKDTASLRQYRDIFNSYFNLGFFQPKKDQCSLCAEWDVLSEEHKTAEGNRELKERYVEHQENKELVRALKKSDKEASREDNGKTTRVLTVDLQKVLYTPTSEVGEFFYKRKLSCYNYTVFDCTLREGHLYVWDQTIAMRGSDETSSFLLDYIEQCVKKGVTKIYIYSDSCAGQNKNQFFLTMYYVAAMKFNITIVHRYLEKGHTQMECDSVHARIEKKGKHKVVTVPSQWYGLMRSAKVKKPAYTVYQKTQEEIFTFRRISKDHFQWSKIPLTRVKEIQIVGNCPGIAKYKLSWKEEERVAQILVPRVGRPVNWKTYELKLAYSGRIALPVKLINDLRWFINKKHIPEAHVGYYNSLFDIERREDNGVNNDPEAGPPEDLFNQDEDEPQEVEPAPRVVDDLLQREYEYQMEEADPFLLEENPDQAMIVTRPDNQENDDSDSDTQ